MPRPRKKVQIDFEEIDAALNRGEMVKLKPLAIRYKTCSPVIKRHFEERYGSHVAFIYGRNGGVRLSVHAPPWWWAKNTSA